MNILQHVPSEALLLLDILNQSGETRLVGGFVRDVIYHLHLAEGGRLPAPELQALFSDIEIDLATEIHYEAVVKVLGYNNVKTIITGAKHGTVTAVVNSKPFEITTLRHDIFCDGRHAEVIFSKDWHGDASRRDFTMNALYMEKGGEVIDYHNGLGDLYESKVNFIGDAGSRITEDYLRILRYFRFIARFGITSVNCETILIIRALSHNLRRISAERIRQEMLKLFAMRFCREVIVIMYLHGVLNSIYLESKSFDIERYLSCDVAETPIVNLALMLICSNVDRASISNLASNWRLSKKEVDDVLFLYDMKDFRYEDNNEISHKKFIHKHGLRKYCLHCSMLSSFFKDDGYMKCYHGMKEQPIPLFPLTGEDLMAIGIKGREIGLILKEVEKIWLEADFVKTKDDLLKYIEEYYLDVQN